MTAPCDRALERARADWPHSVEALRKLLTFASISTDAVYRSEMKAAAEWLAERLRGIGARDVKLFPPDSHPIVYGELRSENRGAPTALVYGHYDVQPAKLEDGWSSHPFDPAVRGSDLYARGSCDMKGPLLSVVFAAEAIRAAVDDLPCHLKFVLEGEEETGSEHLAGFASKHRALLGADFALNPDSGMIAPDTPAITLSFRGIAYFELTIEGPARELHSGVFGGVVHNPAQVLCELISGMHDASCRVTLPDFYSRVRTYSAAERQELARLPLDESAYLEQTAAPALRGEDGYSPVERATLRPTLEIHGLDSGFTAEGVKAIVPARATAKLSTRLVPDQDPSEVKRQLEQYLEANAPPTVRWELIARTRCVPAESEAASAWVRAMAGALQATWGREPLFKREGGSIPFVTVAREILDLDSVNIGWALPDGQMHGPDEHVHLPTLKRGVESLIRFFFAVGKQARRR